MSIYLDYNATTPIDDRVLETMIKVYKESPGNADSRTHEYGNKAHSIVENGRKQIARFLKVQPDEVFFTSGATESDNIAILGLQDYAEETRKKHIITTAIEHKAVLNTIKHLGDCGYYIDVVKPGTNGRVEASNILDLVREDTLLVSVMHVNNETGIIQPVKEIGEALQNKNVLFHVDATQSCGKLVKELHELKYDMLSFSAHKFRGPQGIGALILKKKNYKLPPVKNVYFGGQQEHGIRPGTIPVALVAGMGKACEIAEKEYGYNDSINKMVKSEIMSILEQSGVKYEINGDPQFCIDNTLNICFNNVSSEALMISTKQYCALSNGSACTSKSYEPSHVLLAMGIPAEKIQSSIRISWGPGIDKVNICKNFLEIINTVKKFAV